MRKLYYSNCIGERHTSKEDALKSIAKSERGQAASAYDDLRKWGFLQIKRTGYGEHVSLYHSRLPDVQALINPNPELAVKDRPPLESTMDKDYEAMPFLETYSEKGGKYTYHNARDGSEKIKAYISGEGENVYPINIGGSTESDSLIVKAVKRIDEKFPGRAFERAEMYDLGRDIVGNKQPIKAILDVLLYHNYIIEVHTNYYKRTTKQLPKSGL